MSKHITHIEVVPYDPRWPEQFEREAALLKQTLGRECVAVHHVGSTSVPGLAAKPKIDIILVVRHLEDVLERLATIGFEYRGEYNIPMHGGFSKRGSGSVNLHVYAEGNPEIELNLMFRDYLRSHPALRDEYAALKYKLLQHPESYEKNNSIFTGYNLGKNGFITKVLKLAGFQRLRFVRCTHFDEWAAAKKMRQRYFFDSVCISDPYTWTFTHPDHIHLILYKGVEIIGYAHLLPWPAARVAMRIIVVEEAFRHQGHGRQFLQWIETWLGSKGFQTIHAEASPSAVPFYERLGYTRMPFNDPDGYPRDPRDTPMGKVLTRR